MRDPLDSKTHTAPCTGRILVIRLTPGRWQAAFKNINIFVNFEKEIIQIQITPKQTILFILITPDPLPHFTSSKILLVTAGTEIV